MKISCLIPAYNEEKNISRVLDIATNYAKFAEIIVIDDCSSDNTFKIVENYKKVKLIHHNKNLGKTSSIINAINQAQGSLIVLLDSDLINLTTDNINSLITSLTQNNYDQAILDRAGDRKAIWGFTNCARFFGGERAFWKHDFQNITWPENGGFLLEIILNLEYIKQHKKIKTIYCENLYCVQDFKKRGILQGIKHYSSISYKIVRYSNIPRFLTQIYSIEEDNFAKLYSFHQKTKLKIITIPIIFLANSSSGLWFFLKLNLQSILH